jgi:hypothetical protein
MTSPDTSNFVPPHLAVATPQTSGFLQTESKDYLNTEDRFKIMLEASTTGTGWANDPNHPLTQKVPYFTFLCNQKSLIPGQFRNWMMGYDVTV